MAKHEFGIMQIPPEKGERFDFYEPEKYNCIYIDDDYIEPLLAELQTVACYWHTLLKPEKGLAYYGITLIAPQSIDSLINILVSRNKQVYFPVINLFRQALEEGKYIIHFGI